MSTVQAGGVAADTVPPARHGVSFGEAFRTWFRIAALSFGGPAGQIAVMHRILVEEKRWIGENRFLHALNYCMLLPGPEAQQLAVYIGWLMHRTLGGVTAGVLFILPGFVSILALSYIYVAFGHVTAVAGLFFGLKAAVLAIVVHAVLRIGKRAMKNAVLEAIAVAAFVAIFVFKLPFPLIILTAAIAGYIGGRAGLGQFSIGGGHGSAGTRALPDDESLLGEKVPEHARSNIGWSLRMSALLLFLWLAPVVGLHLAFGPEHVFTEIGVFFSKMAVVTFGGAYAVLAYVAQAAVEGFGWLKPGEMLDGLGMAETTPGPLILVVQFVGFLAAYREAAGINPMLAATLGAILTTWVTFVPCFLWIFLGAPFIERLRGNAALTGAMSAITAAVVGVIANLAVWFGLHVMFGSLEAVQFAGIALDVPVWSSARPAAICLTAAAMLAVFRFNWPMTAVLGASAFAGVAWSGLAGPLG